MIAIASFLVVVYLFGRVSSWFEGEQIAKNIRLGITTELDHKKLTRNRIKVLVALALVFTVAIFWGRWEWWAALVLVSFCGCAYGLFSPVHRWTLNKERKLPWWHLDDLDKGGNRYDEFWWKVWAASHMARASFLRELSSPSDKDRRQVARIAYAFEAAVLIASCFLYFNTTP